MPVVLVASVLLVRLGFVPGSGDAGNIGPRGVTVSTLDSESSDRGSNPREVYIWFMGGVIVSVSGPCLRVYVHSHLWSSGYDVSLTR